MIERLQATYGFTRMPFGRELAPQMLHRHTAHAEAVARITWCIDQHALGVLTGEVGVGKTVAVHAALASLDPARHTLIYLPNPTVGTRGIHHAIVTALGGTPAPTAPPSSPRPPTRWPPKPPNAAAPPSCAARSNSACSPPSTSASPCATTCPA